MEVIVQEVSFILRVCDSDAIFFFFFFFQCFDISRISFLTFDKCIKLLEIENFSSRERSSLGVIRSST